MVTSDDELPSWQNNSIGSTSNSNSQTIPNQTNLIVFDTVGLENNPVPVTTDFIPETFPIPETQVNVEQSKFINISQVPVTLDYIPETFPIPETQVNVEQSKFINISQVPVTSDYIPETFPIPVTQVNIEKSKFINIGDVQSRSVSQCTNRELLNPEIFSQNSEVQTNPIDILTNNSQNIISPILKTRNVPQFKHFPLNNTLVGRGNSNVLIIKPTDNENKELIYNPILLNSLIYSEKCTLNKKEIQDIRVNKQKGIVCIEYSSISLDEILELTKITKLGKYNINAYVPNIASTSVGPGIEPHFSQDFGFRVATHKLVGRF